MGLGAIASNKMNDKISSFHFVLYAVNIIHILPLHIRFVLNRVFCEIQMQFTIAMPIAMSIDWENGKWE